MLSDLARPLPCDRSDAIYQHMRDKSLLIYFLYPIIYIMYLPYRIYKVGRYISIHERQVLRQSDGVHRQQSRSSRPSLKYGHCIAVGLSQLHCPSPSESFAPLVEQSTICNVSKLKCQKIPSSIINISNDVHSNHVRGRYASHNTLTKHRNKELL